MTAPLRVAIIGGGIGGLCIAWHLVRKDCSIDIFDIGDVTRSATWASAGMIAPQGELVGPEDPLFAFASASRALWPLFHAALEKDGASASFAEIGSLRVTLEGQPLDELEALARQHGAPILNAEALHRLAPGLAGDVIAGVFMPDDAHADNRLLIEALHHVLKRMGVRFHTTRQAGIACPEGRACGVTVGDDLFRADAVVVAAGAWSGDIAGIPSYARVPVGPVKGQMIAVEPGPAMLSTLIWGNGAYLVPRQDKAVVIGTTVEKAGFDVSLDAEIARELHARAQRLAPHIIGERILSHWCGFRPAANDLLPVLGESALPGLFYATGQYRNGILFGPLIGQLIGDLIAHGKTDKLLAPFTPLRFARG
ncbi:MAG: FAD-dependent oxidoreductase [Alphaproteobacteria bacterium]|nr:FAD-dependent oxidoreductase [Alphaproteobacteria bacterium]